VVWTVIGYSLAFGDGNAYVGDLSRLFMAGFAGGWDKAFTLGSGASAVATTIPESVFFMFQMTFAIVTPALITGAFADRMKFSALLLFTVLWSILIYSPVAHWVWHPNGWIFALGALDFAGGTVVHINAGVAGLVCALVLGKRVGFGHDNMAPFNLGLAVIGAGLLWVGWFGFNAGSALGAGARAGMALLVTQVAAAAATIAWLLAEWATKGRPSVLGAISGAVAGLVAITPASGFVLPMHALIIGVVAGLAGFWGATALKHMCGYDDSLDAFGVHGICGIVGSLLTGVFAYGALSATPATPAGYAGSFDQFLLQLYATVAVFVFSAIGTFILLQVTNVIVGLRVTEEEEREGLDVTQHGERLA
jgi:Amt family ammonium transporter